MKPFHNNTLGLHTSQAKSVYCKRMTLNPVCHHHSVQTNISALHLRYSCGKRLLLFYKTNSTFVREKKKKTLVFLTLLMLEIGLLCAHFLYILGAHLAELWLLLIVVSQARNVFVLNPEFLNVKQISELSRTLSTSLKSLQWFL